MEILLEERAEINFVEWIFLFFRRDRSLFNGRGGGDAVALFFAPADIVNQRNGIFQLFENRILHHFRIDHVLKLDLVERKDRNHLNKARSQDLPLRQFDVQFVLQHYHAISSTLLTLSFLRNLPMKLRPAALANRGMRNSMPQVPVSKQIHIPATLQL